MQQQHFQATDIVWRLIREHGDEAAIVAYARFAYNAAARHEGSAEQWHRVLDELIDLDFVPNAARNAPIQYAMSSSFAFGGLNAVLVLGRA